MKARKVVIKATKKIADLYPKLDPANDKKFPPLIEKLGEASDFLREALLDLNAAVDYDDPDEAA